MNFFKLAITALALFLITPSMLGQLVVFCGDELTVDNNSGVNNFEMYPERSGFTFSGTERIVQLPASECGEVCFTVSNRMALPGNTSPGCHDCVDLFVLTDPNDPASNILWLNGIGGTACFPAVPGQSYYLVFDGLEGSLASFDLEVDCSIPTCEPDPLDPAFTVPTLGEWGLISLALLLMTVGVVAIKQRRIQAA